MSEKDSRKNMPEPLNSGLVAGQSVPATQLSGPQ